MTDLTAWSDAQPGRLVRVPHRYDDRSGPVYKYYIAGPARREFWAFWPKQRKVEMFFRTLPPLDAGAGRTELDRRLRAIPGVTDGTFPSDRNKVLKLDALLTPEARRRFCRVTGWALACAEAGRVVDDEGDGPVSSQALGGGAGRQAGPGAGGKGDSDGD